MSRSRRHIHSKRCHRCAGLEAAEIAETDREIEDRTKGVEAEATEVITEKIKYAICEKKRHIVTFINQNQSKSPGALQYDVADLEIYRYPPNFYFHCDGCYWIYSLCLVWVRSISRREDNVIWVCEPLLAMAKSWLLKSCYAFFSRLHHVWPDRTRTCLQLQSISFNVVSFCDLLLSWDCCGPCFATNGRWPKKLKGCWSALLKSCARQVPRSTNTSKKSAICWGPYLMHPDAVMMNNLSEHRLWSHRT